MFLVVIGLIMMVIGFNLIRQGSRTAPAMNSSVNCRRARLPALRDPILDIVSAFRKVSTKPDQAQS